MASTKKWFGFAAIGAAVAGFIARLRKRPRPATEGDEPAAMTEPGAMNEGQPAEAEPVTEVADQG